MKAIRLHKEGGPEQLVYEDAPKPQLEVYALTSFTRDGTAAALSQIATLIDAGAVRPVIAQTVPLAEAREAFERGVAGHTRGKLVLTVDKP